jgi:hypothetical protein
VLVVGVIAGTWRARKSGGSVNVTVSLWTKVPTAVIAEPAERLAAFRGLRLDSLEVE